MEEKGLKDCAWRLFFNSIITEKQYDKILEDIEKKLK